MEDPQNKQAMFFLACAPLCWCRALLPLADWLAEMEPVNRTLPPQVRLLSPQRQLSTVLCPCVGGGQQRQRADGQAGG